MDRTDGRLDWVMVIAGRSHLWAPDFSGAGCDSDRWGRSC